MAEQKLQAIGQKLGVSGSDIKAVRRGKMGNAVICAVLGAVIAAACAVTGFLAGRGSAPGCPPCEPCGTCPPVVECPPCPDLPEGYPYAAGLVIPAALRARSKASKVAVLAVAAIALLVALKVPSVFGEAIMYNVFKK